MFKKLLIANRGEIAVRIIKTAKALGIATVAVYSDSDKDSLHVRSADETVALGGGPARDTYLNIEKIVEAAQQTGAEAIHPGYGFLAENAQFARAISDAGIVFIGPPADAITTMGEKVAARNVAISANVPLAPGINEAIPSADVVKEFGSEHGYPVLIKASNGGGGRGMRVAADESAVDEAYEAAVREATAAFGSGDVFAERYLTNARHVEVQVFADQHGNAVYLSDRDCSVQRRHQKLIEEAPAPFLSDDVKKAMGESAVRLALEVGYVGAGTVEFLVDGNDFYFLEMNTRIQVEHPVTEMVTGMDLIAEQISVAAGNPLSRLESVLTPQGVAIEARINAEDVAGGLFLPAPGLISQLAVPEGEGIRWDAGYLEGDTVSADYDSLIGKLVVHAADRASAIRGLFAALGQLQVGGVPTTVPAAMAVLDHPDFASGDFTTRWLEESVELPESGEDYQPPSREDVEILGRYVWIPVIAGSTHASPGEPPVSDGSPSSSKKPSSRRPGKKSNSAVADGVIKAPMQGTIVRANVQPGDAVTAGDVLFVLEAMKMENPMVAPFDGTVSEVHVELGASVAAGTLVALVVESGT